MPIKTCTAGPVSLIFMYAIARNLTPEGDPEDMFFFFISGTIRIFSVEVYGGWVVE